MARVPLWASGTTRSSGAIPVANFSLGGQFFVSPGGQFRMSFDSDNSADARRAEVTPFLAARFPRGSRSGFIAAAGDAG
jgi:hypothetical protein